MVVLVVKNPNETDESLDITKFITLTYALTYFNLECGIQKCHRR